MEGEQCEASYSKSCSLGSWTIFILPAMKVPNPVLTTIVISRLRVTLSRLALCTVRGERPL